MSDVGQQRARYEAGRAAFTTPPMTNVPAPAPVGAVRGGKGYQGAGQRLPAPAIPRWSPTIDRSNYKYQYPNTSNIYNYTDRYHLPWVTPPMTDNSNLNIKPLVPAAPEENKAVYAPPFNYSTWGAPSPETQGVLSYETPAETTPAEEEVVDYGYPYYYGGGGGGGGGGGYSDYVYPNTPFAQYQRGYAMRGTPAQAVPGFRTGGQTQQNYNNNQNVYPARWQQLQVSWRI